MFHFCNNYKFNMHMYDLKKKKKKKKKEKPTYRPSFFSTRYRKQTYIFFWPYKWENAYSKDLNAWKILMDFYIFIKVKSGGGVALVHVYMYV